MLRNSKKKVLNQDCDKGDNLRNEKIFNHTIKLLLLLDLEKDGGITKIQTFVDDA